MSTQAEIYEFIHLLAERESPVSSSTEMEEVIGLCSRVYVMRGDDCRVLEW